MVGNHCCRPLPKSPPNIAPRKREGANTPPEPPDPIVIDVARIFIPSSTPSMVMVNWPSRASPIVLYPTPRTCGKTNAVAPISRPPRLAFAHSGSGTFANTSSLK